mgnify:FL=1
MAAPDIGDFAKDVLDKVLQKNTFECNHCGHDITYLDENKYPLFPCDKCGKIDWKVYAINDKVIYPRSR